MKIKWGARSIGGLILVILAAASLLIDAAGIVQVWTLREPITQDAINTLDLLNSTLDTTSTGLGVVKTSLRSVTATVGTLRATVSSTAVTLVSASASVNSVSTIVGEKLSQTVNSSISALDTVEATTKTIDEVLSGLATLPFLNIKYDPAKSLSTSVSDVTDRLKQVPQSLSDLEKNLGTTSGSLDKVSDDAKTLATNLDQVQSDLSQLVGVIEQYEAQVKAFQATVKNLRENIVTIVWSIVIFATFIFFWLGVTMVQTLVTGLRMVGIVKK